MLVMFSYFELNFIEKFSWESGFSNLRQMKMKQICFFGGHFETQHFLNVLFADLWLF